MIFNRGAYTSEKLNHSVRDILRAEDVLSAGSDIKRIGTVGLIVNEAYRILQSDVTKLKTLAWYCKENDIRIDKEVEIAGYNLLPPMRNDFLLASLTAKDKLPLDLLMLCALPYYGSTYLPKRQHLYSETMEQEVLADYIYSDDMTAVNPMHMSEGIWAEAAHRSSARLVATFGGTCDEISTKAFEGDERWRIIKPSHPHGDGDMSGAKSLGLIELA